MERNKKMTRKAQKLRSELTKEEAKLWYQFLCRFQPRFHRQYVVGNYILDFYCHQAKLAVELDGSQHYSPEGSEKDGIRTEYLEKQGILVMRFSNLDVTRRFREVCEEIYRKVEVRTASNR